MNSQKLTTSILTLFILCSCDPTPQIKIPSPPDFSDIRINIDNTFKTCDKKDSELTFSKEALSNRLFVEDKIESVDIEYTNCDGKIVEKSHGPARNLKKYLTVPAPTNIFEPVQYITIDNARTCVSKSFYAKETDLDKDPVEEITVDGKTFKIPSSSAGTPSGQMRLSLTDSIDKLLIDLNIQNGNNPLKVTYYGKCLKHKNDKSCFEYKTLAIREFLLEVWISRPKGQGLKQIPMCSKK